jgi:hypothetical protein
MRFCKEAGIYEVEKSMKQIEKRESDENAPDIVQISVHKGDESGVVLALPIEYLVHGHFFT